MTLIYFLIVIGILVFVHELGHFIMAKRAGVRVEKFSLGMGPKVGGYKKGDTEYVISALPLGGYVKMAGENPDEEKTGAQDEFQAKTVWQRAKIAAAGSLTNIALAFIVMPFVFMIGVPAEGPARVGFVEKGSPAERSGFKEGDVLEKINGRSIDGWTKALSLIAVNPESDVQVRIDRDGEKMSFVLRPEVATEFKIGSSGLVPDMLVEIGAITSGFPADKAGIRLHDKILAVDGKTIYHWNQFARSVRESSGKPMKFAIERDNRRTSVTVSAIESSGTYVIGVQPFQNLVITKHGFFESLSLGFHKTIEVIDLTFITLKKLMTFSLSIKTLGGPVMIAQMSGQAAEIGLSAFLGLLAMVSVSLGILNLLPIPVLDGGLLVFLGIEAVRKKPLSEKTMQIAQNVGAVLLIGLIVVVSYNDVMRVFFNN